MTGIGELAAGFSVGLVGSVHCVGMCGGIAGALAMSAATQPRGRVTEPLRQVLYGSGRVTSYALAGAIAGGVGSAAAAAIGPGGTSLLRVVAAALIVALGLYLGGWWNGLAAVERAGALLWKRLAPATRALRPGASMPRAFVLGMLWGWLPCGLVYSALALATAAGSAAGGAMLMAGFGAGTVPAVAGTGLAARQIGALLRAPASRSAAGVIVIALGIWTLAGSGVLPLPGAAGTQDHCAGHADPAVQASPSAQ